MTNTTQMWFRLLMTTVFSCFAFSTLSLPLQINLWFCRCETLSTSNKRVGWHVRMEFVIWLITCRLLSLIIISAIQEHNVWIRSTIMEKMETHTRTSGHCCARNEITQFGTNKKPLQTVKIESKIEFIHQSNYRRFVQVSKSLVARRGG